MTPKIEALGPRAEPIVTTLTAGQVQLNLAKQRPVREKRTAFVSGQVTVALNQIAKSLSSLAVLQQGALSDAGAKRISKDLLESFRVVAQGYQPTQQKPSAPRSEAPLSTESSS